MKRDAATRMIGALAEVKTRALEPVVIYGAGQHARKVIPALIDSPVRIAAFVDDSPERQSAGFCGWPVIPAERLPWTGAKALIINTDRYEPQIWSQKDRFEDMGLTVFRLYPELDGSRPLGQTGDLAEIELAMDLGSPLGREALHTYWATRGAPQADDTNALSCYTRAVAWSCFLADWIANTGLDHHATILELGCNLGRNLAFLRYRGYTRLTAIEINPHAIAAMRDTYPLTAASSEIRLGALEEVLPNLPERSYDLVFSVGVLVHIHSESAFILDHIARVARQYILTIEDERSLTPRHFPRDYQDVFAARSWRQIRVCDFRDAGSELTNLLGLQPEYVARLFERA